MMVKSGVLSQNRSFLYGIAAVFVLLVHFGGYLAVSNRGGITILSKLLRYGQLGVPIFGFLSGISCYYSLSRGTPRSVFWKNRIKRTFIPYLIISGSCNFVLDILIKRDIMAFLMDVSTLSFWLYHHGPWYLAMLIPVYLCMPWYGKTIDNTKNRGRATLIAGSIWLLLGAVLYYTSPELYDHLHLLHQTVFIIMIGYCCGKKVRTDMPVPLSGVVAIFIVYVAQVVFRKAGFGSDYTENIFFSLLSVPFCFAASYAVDFLPKCVVAFLKKLGTVSLECYLFNTYFGFLLREYLFVRFPQTTFAGGSVAYVFCAVLEILLALSTIKITEMMYRKIKT